MSDRPKEPIKPKSLKSMQLQIDTVLNKSRKPNPDVVAMFEPCLEEVALLDSKQKDIVEIDFQEIEPIKKSAQIDSLFELAKEIIKNKKIDSEYIEAESLKREHKIEAVELKDTFKKFEKVLAAGKNFSLRKFALGGRAGQADDYRGDEIKISEQLRPPLIAYLKALGIDLGLTSLFALALTIFLILIFDGAYRSNLIKPFVWTKMEVCVYVGCYLIAFTICLCIYPIITNFLYNHYPGHNKYNIRLLKTNGYAPNNFNILLRAVSTPISFFFFGYLPLLYKKRTLQDLVAGTVPIYIESVTK